RLRASSCLLYGFFIVAEPRVDARELVVQLRVFGMLLQGCFQKVLRFRETLQRKQNPRGSEAGSDVRCIALQYSTVCGEGLFEACTFLKHFAETQERFRLFGCQVGSFSED